MKLNTLNEAYLKSKIDPDHILESLSRLGLSQFDFSPQVQELFSSSDGWNMIRYAQQKSFRACFNIALEFFKKRYPSDKARNFAWESIDALKGVFL